MKRNWPAPASPLNASRRKANEGVARLNLSYSRVVAPISGRVGLRTVDVGNVVSSSDANGIALITQLSPIDVVFAVPQDMAGSLQQSAVAGTVMKVTALDRTRSSVLSSGLFASVDKIQVASGLTAGEQVITEGADRLKDGAPVVLPGDALAGPRGGASGSKGQRSSSARPGASAPANPEAATDAAKSPASGAPSPQRRRGASQAEGA